MNTIDKLQCPACQSTAILPLTERAFECLDCGHVNDADADRQPSGDCPPRKVVRNFTCVCGTLPQVAVVKRRYNNGGIALFIEAKFDGRWETLMIASAWIPGIPEGHVAIKDYSENVGCLRQLTNAGVVDDPQITLKGFPICRVLF